MIGENVIWIREALGLGVQPKDLNAGQVALRAVLVFIAALAMVRLSDRRMFAKKTAFELVLAVVLASMLARVVNGTAPVFETLLTGFLLIGIHRLVASTAFRSRWFEKLVKGSTDCLIENGRLQHKNITRHHFTDSDLAENLRIAGGVTDVAEVQSACLERSGEVSVVKKQGRQRTKSHQDTAHNGIVVVAALALILVTCGPSP